MAEQPETDKCTTERIVSLRDIFKGAQLQVWEDYYLCTLQDLVKFLSEHTPFELVPIKFINKKTLAIAVLACHDHGYQLNNMWESWFLSFTSKEEEGKTWIRDVNRQKEEGTYNYGLSGKNNSLELYHADQKDMKLSEAEKVIIYYLSSSGSIPDPSKTCKAFNIPFNSPQEASRKVNKYWNLLKDANRLEEVKILAGCNLEVVFIESIKNLERCMTEKKFIWVNVPDQKCPTCKKLVQFNRKIKVEIDVTKENVAAARELARISQSIEEGKRGEVGNVPDTPEDAFEQLAEVVARVIRASEYSLKDFEKKVEEKLAA